MKGTDMTGDLSPDVQMQLMRPGQMETAARKFPVVYVPFGLIEWHGRHLPLGGGHRLFRACGGIVDEEIQNAMPARLDTCRNRRPDDRREQRADRQ